MKAFILKVSGDPGKLLTAEFPVPRPGPGELLIRVKAISINPVDAFVRRTPTVWKHFFEWQDGQEFVIPGWDMAGTVVQTGVNVNGFKEGDDVFGLINFKGQGSVSAEYLVTPASHVARKPAILSWAGAAASGLAAVTAWQSLVTYGEVRNGESVLVHAGAGGVGHFAIQIAKHLGATVATTVSTDKQAFAKQLGADVVIDYTRVNFADEISNVDFVLDPIPGDHLRSSITSLRPHGRLISLMSNFDDREVAREVAAKNIFSHRLDVTSNGEDMRAIASLIESGAIKPAIAATFPFAQLPEAHRLIEKGKTAGKIVVEV